MNDDEVIERFRTGTHERLERLETAWAKLTSDPHDAETAAALERDLHTLKGEARMVGFADVDMVAHKLEDVLEVCRERAFQISDDIDLVVTMALRFMAMLIRKKAGQLLGGIDLPGFVRQIDSVIKETRKQHPLRGRIQTSSVREPRELISGKVRDRLAAVALDLFLELASGRDSKRVRRSWQALRDSLAPADPELVAPVLGKHESGARELAEYLGKSVIFEFALDAGARAPASVVNALDIATLHLVRNAIDHGIESPDERAAAGKPELGSIRVRCVVEQARVVLEVTDDGRGIDFPSVRTSAIALGLVTADATPTDAELSKLLFHPGLTTRAEATAVSGRGIGLDAVHGSVSAVGGDVEVSSSPHGTRWVISVPSPLRRFRVHVFAVRGTNVPFAVPIDWQIEIENAATGTLDLVEELGIGMPTANPYTYELTRGDSIVRIAATGEPVEAEARWLVSTAADSLAGVVSIDGQECLVLRPELLIASTGRVAIVDDSEIIRELVRFSLQPHGIEVQLFDSPEPLVGTLAVKPVELVLLDLSFKGVDIRGLVQRIKAALPDCAVYLHSDRTPIELAQIAEKSGADGYLAKALGRDQFVTRVLKILRRR